MVGLMLIILAQVAYAFGGLVIRKYLGEYNPILVSTLMAITSVFFFLADFVFLFLG